MMMETRGQLERESQVEGGREGEAATAGKE